MPEHGAPTAWKRFWERGGWWKGVLLAAVYYGLYLLDGLGISAIAAPMLTDPQ